jgi:hypothetical protein
MHGSSKNTVKREEGKAARAARDICRIFTVRILDWRGAAIRMPSGVKLLSNSHQFRIEATHNAPCTSHVG